MVARLGSFFGNASAVLSDRLREDAEFSCWLGVTVSRPSRQPTPSRFVVLRFPFSGSTWIGSRALTSLHTFCTRTAKLSNHAGRELGVSHGLAFRR
jgi:hypothetical protein